MYPGPICWHEAGHAFAAQLLGGEVRLVSIESEQHEHEHEGRTEVAWPPFSDLPRRSAMVALAGPMSEILYRQELPDESELSAFREDWQEAESQLKQLANDPVERDKLRRTLLDELAIHLREGDHWERLARVADALHAHGTLDADSFQDAVG